LTPASPAVVLAPASEDAALERLRTKKNLRILRTEGAPGRGVELREIWGGTLVQDVDSLDAAGDDPAGWTLAAGAAADEQTLADLAFAWRAVRAVKSNAILLAKDSAAVGIGMGQVNRLDSCRLAVTRANTLGEHAEGDSAPERARGAVAASDAFFPFADGAQILIDAGVCAIVQPGGSIRDEDVIEACRAAGVTLYLTGARHFAHCPAPGPAPAGPAPAGAAPGGGGTVPRLRRRQRAGCGGTAPGSGRERRDRRRGSGFPASRAPGVPSGAHEHGPARCAPRRYAGVLE